ncbi:hypothetical protein [Candidatus Phytoplasma oryzae]|nr:hypothetical protein [Candidatus Phytoplasma oryzae]
MFPKITGNSFVINKKISLEECRRLKASPTDGDIIIFHNITKNFYIMHRVIINNPQKEYVTTKGDNNNNILPDEIQIPYQNIINKNIFHLNYFSLLFIILSVYFFLAYLLIEKKENIRLKINELKNNSFPIGSRKTIFLFFLNFFFKAILYFASYNFLYLMLLHYFFTIYYDFFLICFIYFLILYIPFWIIKIFSNKYNK